MELRGKRLSERLDSTLKLFCMESSSPRYSTTVLKIASRSFSQARQRHIDAIPKIAPQASHAPSTSHSSFRGST